MNLFADVRDPCTWRRLAYLLIAFPLGVFYFTFLVSGISTGLGLAITLTGIPVLIAMMFAWRALAGLERYLLRHLADTPLEANYRPTEGQGRLDGVWTRAKDPATWKDLFYLLLSFPLSLFSFVVVVVTWSAGLTTLFAPAYYWAVPDGIEVGLFNADQLLEALALVPLGAVLTLLALRVVHWVTRLHTGLGRVLLTSAPDPELTARVLDLRSSRARMVAAADAERQRLERDLHDGAQQRLVSLSLTLSVAHQRAANGDREGVEELIVQAGDEAKHALEDLRDLARGLHPAILTNRGLGPALDELGRRARVPVEVRGAPDLRLPPAVESTAYFVVSEALTNVVKYAGAEGAIVDARLEGDELIVEVLDDGTGGARLGAGSGLIGLQDRLGALDGTLAVESPPGGGTHVTARMPAFAAPEEETADDAIDRTDPAELARAHQTRRRHRFRTHAVVFGIVLSLLTSIWAVTGAGYFWPVWTLLGWGAGLALHAWLAYGNDPPVPRLPASS